MNKELAPNANLSHYRIISKLGEGGMGEVFLAEDTNLSVSRDDRLIYYSIIQTGADVRMMTLD